MTTSRRIAAGILSIALGLGGVATLSGILTSPGPVGHSRQVAIPGVRGTGSSGGGKTAQTAMATGRKAGGNNPLEYV